MKLQCCFIFRPKLQEVMQLEVNLQGMNSKFKITCKVTNKSNIEITHLQFFIASFRELQLVVGLRSPVHHELPAKCALVLSRPVFLKN